jgi:hypothetical protein
MKINCMIFFLGSYTFLYLNNFLIIINYKYNSHKKKKNILHVIPKKLKIKRQLIIQKKEFCLSHKALHKLPKIITYR